MARLGLPQDCTLRFIKVLHSQLVDDAAGSDDVVLDGSAVSSIDIAGLQLLATSAREAATAPRGWRLEAPSDALTAALARAGIRFDPMTGRLMTNEIL